MGMYLNQIIANFTGATLRYCDSFIANVPAQKCDTDRYTTEGCCGIIIPLEGSATFGLNDKTYDVAAGTIAHAGPSMFLCIQAHDELFRYAVVHYEPSTPNELEQSFSLKIEQHHQLQLLVQQLLHYEKLPGNLHRLKCNALFAQLIENMFICAKMNTDLEQSDLVECMLTYLTKHYNEPVSIQEVSEMLQCDRRRLTYLFEKQIGLSPIQFLTGIRIKHAKELLRTTSIPIGEIGEAVGYMDPFYFSRVFKKNMNMTPTAYREQFAI